MEPLYEVRYLQPVISPPVISHEDLVRACLSVPLAAGQCGVHMKYQGGQNPGPLWGLAAGDHCRQLAPGMAHTRTVVVKTHQQEAGQHSSRLSIIQTD